MDDFINELLDNMNEGITILNDNLEIVVWNGYIERITEIERSKAIGKNIYEVIPNLDRNYFNNAIQTVLDKGSVMFFSAAMHKDILNSTDKLNLKISRLSKDNSNLLLLEFIDVSNKIAQISQLKQYVNDLYRVNKELLEKENIIKKLAYYDSLTGVANRNRFYKLANRYLRVAKEQNISMAIMFIDIDDFKFINDTFGHLIGDKILVRVANILQNAVGPADIVARYGGDEFLILLYNIGSETDYKDVIYKINNAENKVVSFANMTKTISLSIGVSVYPDDGDSIDKLMAKADQAMYIAKNRED